MLPAATVLLLRDTPEGLEVLMTRRSATASFAPGAYVFPGGRIEASDAVGQPVAVRLHRGQVIRQPRFQPHPARIGLGADDVEGPLHDLGQVDRPSV